MAGSANRRRSKIALYGMLTRGHASKSKSRKKHSFYPPSREIFDIIFRQPIGSAAVFYGWFAVGAVTGRIFKIFAQTYKRKATYFFDHARYTINRTGGLCLYLDVLWFLNFIVDLLLLVAANRLSGYPTSLGRTLLAAVVGGFYGSVCVIPGLRFLAGTHWRLVFLGLMAYIAFGISKDAIRRCILFVILSMALGGIALGIGKGGFLSVLLCAAAVCVMCMFGLRGRFGSQFLPVEIRYNGKCHRFIAMVDTGNTLTDPITGQQVMVVSSGLGQKLLGQGMLVFSDPVSAISHIQGGRLIPYHSVGVEGGLLAAKRFQDVTIGKWRGECLIAFSPQELGKGEVYEALTGGIS